VSNACARLFHDIALCSEATHVGQILYCIRQSRAVRFELKTDNCLFKPQKRRQVELSALHDCDRDRFRDRCEPAEQMRRLDECCAMAPNPCRDVAFRCINAEEKDRLHTEPALPERRAEQPDTRMVWRDVDETIAKEWV
jgi:hypothetical protein